MSLVDRLLQMDSKQITDMPKREVEVSRLTKLFNEPFRVVCQAIDGERYADIQKQSIDLNNKGGVRNINLFEMQVLTVLDGVVEPNLKDKKLLKHFSCITPKELVKKLFLAGEIAELSNVITELSGYDQSEQDEQTIKK